MTKQWLSNKKRKRKKRLNNLVSAVAQVNEVIALTCKPFFFFLALTYKPDRISI